MRAALSGADLVLASDLTLIECDRVLIRAVGSGQLSERKAQGRSSRLRHAAESWTLIAVGPDVVERARRPFPGEPIRTLDAIHLATAVIARAAVPGIAMLSLDARIRACAEDLGFALLPEP